MDTQMTHETLLWAVKSVTRSWEVIKKDLCFFREEVADTYFNANPTRKVLFYSAKYGKDLTTEEIEKRFFKHSVAVINCMAALVEFVNGNEECKPIFFVLGKQHKLKNVNEKMFLEMKDTICSVIRKYWKGESARAWDITLQFVFINYIFQGMHMIEII